MKKVKLRNVAMIACLAMITVFSSCKKDNDNLNNNSDNSVQDPEGTIIVSMRGYYGGNNDGPIYYTYVLPDGSEEAFIIWNDNFHSVIQDGYCTWKFVTIGKVSGLGAITAIPTNGWASQVAVTPGYGYVGRSENRKYDSFGNYITVSTNYIRIYVVNYIIAAGSGGIIGAEIKYQSPFGPETFFQI